MSAEGTSSVTAGGVETSFSTRTLLALIRILYPSLTGENAVIVQNERNYADVQNEQNYVEVVDQ